MYSITEAAEFHHALIYGSGNQVAMAVPRHVEEDSSPPKPEEAEVEMEPYPDEDVVKNDAAPPRAARYVTNIIEVSTSNTEPESSGSLSDGLYRSDRSVPISPQAPYFSATSPEHPDWGRRQLDQATSPDSSEGQGQGLGRWPGRTARRKGRRKRFHARERPGALGLERAESESTEELEGLERLLGNQLGGAAGSGTEFSEVRGISAEDSNAAARPADLRATRADCPVPENAAGRSERRRHMDRLGETASAAQRQTLNTLGRSSWKSLDDIDEDSDDDEANNPVRDTQLLTSVTDRLDETVTATARPSNGPQYGSKTPSGPYSQINPLERLDDTNDVHYLDKPFLHPIDGLVSSDGVNEEDRAKMPVKVENPPVNGTRVRFRQRVVLTQE